MQQQERGEDQHGGAHFIADIWVGGATPFISLYLNLNKKLLLVVVIWSLKKN